ncbi:MAG: hypothetical protein K2O45_02340 [Oscillospiraceae bacterium]|nr:hypothetical protein [Oscillospiraceae bacterium]
MNQKESTKTYMSEQEFTTHMDGLIPTPSAETNSRLLDLANGLWLEMKEEVSHVTANKAVLGPGSRIAEKLSQLTASNPITAARITMDVDSGIAAVAVNPLWEQLRNERESGPPMQQKRSARKRSSRHKNQPDR